MVRKYFIVWWTVATALGFAFARFAAAFIPDWLWFLQGAGIGLIIGTCQWLVLRSVDEYANGWIAATVASWAFLSIFTLDWVPWAGPWIGMMQFIVLQGRRREAGWWVVTNAAAWFFVWWFVVFFGLLVIDSILRNFVQTMVETETYLYFAYPLFDAVEWGIGGAVFGLITAVHLAFMLDAPVSSE